MPTDRPTKTVRPECTGPHAVGLTVAEVAERLGRTVVRGRQLEQMALRKLRRRLDLRRLAEEVGVNVEDER